MRTIEGNTSSGSEVIANGGAVCQKEYSLNNSRIDGYGRPDWSLVEAPSYEVGWRHDSNGWWYVYSEMGYCKSCWRVINGHKYYFNSDGYALAGWQRIQDNLYERKRKSIVALIRIMRKQAGQSSST